MRDEAVAFRRVERAEMVRAFILSNEYRQRFAGSPSGNQIGAALEELEANARYNDRPFADSFRDGALQFVRTFFLTG